MNARNRRSASALGFVDFASTVTWRMILGSRRGLVSVVGFGSGSFLGSGSFFASAMGVCAVGFTSPLYSGAALGSGRGSGGAIVSILTFRSSGRSPNIRRCAAVGPIGRAHG